MNGVSQYLLSLEAIGERSNRLLDYGLRGETPFFSVNIDALPAATDYVLEVCKERYQLAKIPGHSRINHYSQSNDNHWAWFQKPLEGSDGTERMRLSFELLILSVLLDAGAGHHWIYLDHRTNTRFSRSEGLAVAVLNAFVAGVFSQDLSMKCGVTPESLACVSLERLREVFQVSSENLLSGLEGRFEVIACLGEIIANDPIFHVNGSCRLGHLFDFFLEQDTHGRGTSATFIFDTLVRSLTKLWPGRFLLEGRALGDCWQHPLLKTSDESSLFIPFHKLTSWLCYTLVDGLEKGGVKVIDQHELKGLAEYRNGGFMIDIGLLSFNHPGDAEKSMDQGHPLVVEWRGLTVALLEKLRESLCRRLNLNGNQLLMAHVLEGGTWAAGRKIARQLRPEGHPPLQIVTDGTLF